MLVGPREALPQYTQLTRQTAQQHPSVTNGCWHTWAHIENSRDLTACSAKCWMWQPPPQTRKAPAMLPWVYRPVFHELRAYRQKTPQATPQRATAAGNKRKKSMLRQPNSRQSPFRSVGPRVLYALEMLEDPGLSLFLCQQSFLCSQQVFPCSHQTFSRRHWTKPHTQVKRNTRNS